VGRNPAETRRWGDGADEPKLSGRSLSNAVALLDGSGYPKSPRWGNKPCFSPEILPQLPLNLARTGLSNNQTATKFQLGEESYRLMALGLGQLCLAPLFKHSCVLLVPV